MKFAKNLYYIKSVVRVISVIILLISGNNIIAQNDEQKIPIVYLESFLGGYTGENGGLLWGGVLNYQFSKNLLSLRYSKINDISVSSVVLIPVSNTNAFADEIAVLYGRRKINDGHSLSISLGPSYTIYASNSLNDLERERIRAFGAAFETNIKWFKKQKRNPFGFSYGIKLSGNVSKNYYFGLSFMLGIGWHKLYN
ncbi:hypothetical protein LB465_14080 [Salegentibacter sp. LM13S]|uniref:hypothetical protein n=1 Tax=Salegentibacter lacus TaxID=2873599 RepID=UPI001CCEEA4A|nr:hypothetical protein [Salegentibacter lacus]MBZ9631913.1 hypothetical protein [Salegentibacter lacus]